jgi:hypothetical protein
MTVTTGASQPVDNSDDVPLFDGFDPPTSSPDADLSAGQRLTLRQAQQITQGIHPMTLAYTLPLLLHPDADRARTRNTHVPLAAFTCGTCVFRQTIGHRSGTYPKCTRPGAPVSHGPATDVRAWWPACTHYEPAPEKP